MYVPMYVLPYVLILLLKRDFKGCFNKNVCMY